MCAKCNVEIAALVLDSKYDQANLRSLFATGTDALDQVAMLVPLNMSELDEDTRQQPLFGNTDHAIVDWGRNPTQAGHCEGGVQEYVTWFSDAEDSRYEIN